MPIPLPHLDDRRWADLVDEARALIPVYAPEWTDHNLHDPGITLIELLAWLTETNPYRLNRIPESHKRKFLSLVGVRPRPPLPSRVIVALATNDDAGPVFVPATVEFIGANSLGERTQIRTLRDIHVA